MPAGIEFEKFTLSVVAPPDSLGSADALRVRTELPSRLKAVEEDLELLLPPGWKVRIEKEVASG